MMGFQTRSGRGGSSALVRGDAETGKSSAAASQGGPSSALGRDVAKSATAIKPVPLDPDAFMDYLLEEDAVIMEHLAK
ncbi:hypothetical protein [Rhizobium sp. S163]|uniref:hypothetical protein n=1 Tax=Rhizobium sp. S163 TaxID=3055039 RepID=UPI0025A969C9|nr:hypothetical protein [Rhizobium sp. S163]MDM9644581.1 hypothetical protein [Rhizobium sp. S163]